MAHHNVHTLFSVYNCLDEEFDEADIAADHALCRAIVAGRMGLHPDGWGNHDSLTAIMPQGFRGYEWVPQAYRRPIARSAAAIAEQSRPVEEPKPPRRKPKPRPQWHWVARADRFPSSNAAPRHGTLQLTCDVCNRARFGDTVGYYNDRPRMVAEIRALGHQHGWTCIAGIDRCPRCSQVQTVTSSRT